MIKSIRELDRVEMAMVAAASITGIIHLYVGMKASFSLLTLAGAGFLGGATIFLTGRYRELTVAASIPYTAVQFPLYYNYYGFSVGPTAAFDKIVQLLFIAASFYYLYRERYGVTQGITGTG